LTVLRLAPLGPAHAAQMNAWMHVAEIAENLGLRSEPSLARTLEWIARATEDDSILPFAILSDEVHVGNVVFDRIDAYLSSARLSIYVGVAGVGQPALRLALDWAFSQRVPSLNKVWLTVHVENARAIAAYTKVGFRVEGTLRDEFVLRGRRTDALMMSVLRRDMVSE